jgi:hypothetical protein
MAMGIAIRNWYRRGSRGKRQMIRDEGKGGEVRIHFG